MTIRRKAQQLARQFGRGAEEAEDFEQENALRLWRAQQRYDPARSSRATFARRVLDNQAASILKSRDCDKRRLESPATPGAGDAERMGEVIDISDLLARDRELRDEEALRIDVANVLAMLPSEYRELCSRLMQRTVADSAKALGRSRSSTYDSISKIRGHFERAGLGDHLSPDTSASASVRRGRR